MSSPTNSQNQPPTSPPQDPNFTQQNQNPNKNQFEDSQSPKTLTLVVPDTEEENPNPQSDDPNQSDPEDIAQSSPTISDSRVAFTTVTIPRRGCGGGGNAKRKKRRGGKKSHKKLELLVENLNPVPFRPIKNLDFASHESLLKKLGLWDFVHLQFDISNLRADLLAQLIANFNAQCRHSYVNNVRIKVSRPDLARALQLPVKKDKVDNALEDMESKESIEFVEEFVSTWLLLHEDTWMMTDDVLNVNKLIKGGNFEKVDWSELIWLMVKKELAAAPNLRNCYYASHLQLLIRSQRDDLFKDEVVKLEIDIKEDDDEEEDVKISEEIHGVSELEEHNIKLSLGGLDNMVKDDDEDEKAGKEEAVGEEEAMDFEGSKEDEEQGQWRKSSMDGSFLQRCNLGDVGAVECEVGKKQEEGGGEDEGKEGENGEEEEGEEEEEEEQMAFNMSPKGDGLDGINSENLIAAMAASQNPFSSGVQIRNNVSSGDFLASRVDAQSIPGSSSLFSNVNGNKRDIDHLENDMPHHALNSATKRMRSDGPWDMKSLSEFDVCFEQMERVMGKARMLYEAKEQAFQELSIHQQMLMNELQQRENMIQHLHKAKLEEQQKRQLETYRLERELYMMGNLLEGYRKALKETHKAFADYRAKCRHPEEPIYKDTGSGGLVLSTTELEKLRLKQEEEERQKRLFAEKKVKEFEAGCISQFEAYKDRVNILCDKLPVLEKELNVLKEDFGKRKVSEKLECAPAKESIPQESV
ncbi:uncharacterized protein LOC8264228 [Ricinus communis]|uniref:Uncharacterized protein n=1 Tax=Ricinus communis TaxID=3988 RepID=B9SGM4_RICCO|nr:uncharacterized protein LOC8264228 [Ricinus communis]EEF37270.1 conserved hypothetical protein [Ricinus communis]|eukprot:XP_002525143.1 uncharacterized protein LOC8264228 [Ricinus communis]